MAICYIYRKVYVNNITSAVLLLLNVSAIYIFITATKHYWIYYFEDYRGTMCEVAFYRTINIL